MISLGQHKDWKLRETASMEVLQRFLANLFVCWEQWCPSQEIAIL